MRPVAPNEGKPSLPSQTVPRVTANVRPLGFGAKDAQGDLTLPAAQLVALSATIPDGRDAYPKAPPGGFLKHYEIIRKLGEGGMGVVLLARDTKLGRLVAIKLLQDSGQATSRLLAEARATALCKHENIVVIHDVDETNGHPYMVLEYLEGRTLRDVLSAGARGSSRMLPKGLALDIMLSVLRALIAAHGRNVVHRDLKPENIMILDAGGVKVLDFGIARRADALEPSQGGTLAYMAPEQWRGENVDTRADLWAIGVILYELLAGAHPFEPLTIERLANVADLDTPMPSLRDVLPELSALSEVVERCLCKRKEQRFASADEVLAALTPLREGGKSLALTEGESPFAGLSAFQEADAGRFFGRERDIAALVGRLGRQRLVMVLGPSGAGKSSFLRAGVIPALKHTGEEWDVLVLRPGRAPLSALAEALVQGDSQPSISNDDLRAEPGSFGARLRAHCRARGPESRTLIFVDQFEELYTLASDPGERAAFLQCLLGAADDPSSPLRVIVTIRSDFLDRVAEDPQFLAEATQSLFLLPPMGRDGLREALVRPVEAAGYRFEDEAMITQVLDELSHAKTPLPLLQFAAVELWEARDRAPKILTRASYEQLGGVIGALSTHADAVFAALSLPNQRLCHVVFLRLVTPERTRAVVSLSELTSLSDDPAAVEALVQHLCGARLLLLEVGAHSGAITGAITVEIVHESLIERWPRLARWLDESTADAQFVARLRAATSQWQAGGEASGLLWRDRAAEQARTWYERRRANPEANRGLPLGRAEQRYLAAVMDLSERHRRRRQQLIVGAFVFISAVAIIVFFLAIRARDQAHLADANAQRADAEAARVKEQNETLAFQALRGRNAMRILAARKRQEDPTLVLALLREVESQDIPKDWSELLSPALSQGVSSVVRVETGARPVYDAAISPDGKRIVTAMNDYVALILDADTLEERHVLRGHQEYVWTAAWSPDGQRIVTASGDKTARIWPADGTGEPLVLRHADAVYAARFSPDGKLVVTASADHTARISSVVDGKELVVLRHPVDLLFAEFSPDGKRVATGGPDTIVRLWNTDGTGEPQLLRGHDGPLVAAAFSPDGTSLASASRDQTIRVWDLATGKERFVLRGHDDQVRGVSWSPDGKHIASASRDKTARIWNADGIGVPLVLRGHEHWLYTAKFSPDSRRLVTASLDRSIRVWNLDQIPAPALVQNGTGNVAQLSFSPNSQRFAMVASDEIVVGSSPGPAAKVDLLGHITRFGNFVWSPDSTRIASASLDQGALIWNADGAHAPLVLRDDRQEESLGVAWCAESNEILTISFAGVLRRWSNDGHLLSKAQASFQSSESYVTLSPDRSCNRLLVAAGRNTFVQVWNVRDAGEPMTIGKRDATIGYAGWSADGSHILVVYTDRVVRLWDLDGGAPMTFADAQSVTHARFSPDGRRIALVFDDGNIQIWNADGTGKPLAFGIPGNRLNRVDWSPDGTRLITASLDRVARVWNADGSGIPFALVGPRTQIGGPSWSSDGKYIAVQSDEPMAHIWPDVHPFTGPDDSRLWGATSYCIPVPLRRELLQVTEAEAQTDYAACDRRVMQARAAQKP